MVHIHQITQIGTFHTNYCEDFTVHAPLSTTRHLLAVLDGCTMGTESFFASALIGKILRKISRDGYYKDYLEATVISLEHQLEQIVQQLFEALIRTKNDLALDRLELLSTLVIAVVDEQEKEAVCLVVGDGVIAVNGIHHTFDQNNVPDYLGYHLQEPFKEWYAQQQQRLKLSNVTDLALSTDGIFTFSPFASSDIMTIGEDKLLDLLLHDRGEPEHEKFYTKKLLKIEREWGLRPADDLGIVRLIFA